MYNNIICSNTYTATAEVVGVQSSLTATGRDRACPDETLTFTCEVNGEYLQWTFIDTSHRTTFYHDDDVNTTETVFGQYGVQAELTGNDPIPGPKSPTAISRHFTSILVIESSNLLLGSVYNISCCSNTDTQVQQLKIAGNSGSFIDID